MDLAPTERFSSRAEAYVRGRPGYPREMLTLLERDCGITPAWRVADIGSGTGLLAALFLGYGCEVFGVEPNAQMRAAGERELRAEPRFHSVDARAEATGLASGEVDLVTAGQAFHWFEPASARAEFRRILRAGGWVALAWNERRHTAGFMEEHEALQDRFAREKAHPSEDDFNAFFGNRAWRLAMIPNPQALDEETLLQRMESCSWAPEVGTDGHKEMVTELRRLFRDYAHDGRIVMEYETRIYYGRRFVNG
jgi:SAM-dependent methyltransferase